MVVPGDKSTQILSLFLSLTLLAAVLLFAGCERTSDSQKESLEGPPRSEEGIQTRSRAIPAGAGRIVSMAPSTTELLFALGVGDRVVAVTRYCDWPVEVKDLPTIGGMLDPDLEVILGLQPDLVVGVQAGSDHRIGRVLENADIAYGFVEANNLEEIYASILTFGDWLELEDSSRELIAKLKQELEEESRALREKITSGTRVLMVYDQEPVVAAGPGTFGDELLTLAGLSNVVTGDSNAYPVLDMERIIGLNPEIVIDTSIGPKEEEVLRFWGRFSAIDAVQNQRVIHLSDPLMMRPGPRLPEALRLLGEAIEGL